MKMNVKASVAAGTLLACLVTTAAHAVLITDPNDPRSFQGATVGTFAALFYGADTPANRQLLVDNQLLDDGVFNTSGFVTGSLLATPWANGTGGSPSQNGGGCRGRSLDLTGTGSFAYTCANNNSVTTVFNAANGIDEFWFQSSDTIGDTVFDLGFQATKAAVFNTIDHGPLPGEAIESTVYLSNDLSSWTQAVVERVWLEGFQPNLGIKWDGFVYAVGTGTSQTFRYASIIHGGPGSLRDDGDDEINGVMGLQADFTGSPTVPEPGTLALLGMGLAGFSLRRRQRAGPGPAA